MGFRAYVGFWFHCSPNPYYYSCPLRFLDMADELSPSWRKAVLKCHLANQLQAAFLTA